MDTLKSNFSDHHSFKLFPQHPNSTFNSTDSYEDPVIIFLNAVTSDIAKHYLLIGTYVTLFILFVLPLIAILLFHVLNNFGAYLIFATYRFLHLISKDTARNAIYTWWYWIGKIWFGYEIIGFEHIPPDGAFLTVTMHGIFPAFVPCSWAIFARQGRSAYGVIDKKHANQKLLNEFFELVNFGAWTRDECVKFLQEGNDVSIMPGGSYEMMHADSNYNIDWGKRKGYCQVAKDAKVPIYPTYCINLLEACWTPFFIKPFSQGRFSSKRFPIYFCWGALPVKLASIVGKPILYDESKTVDQMHEECLNTIRLLRDANQRLPGNKFYALLDRFRKIKPKKDFMDTSTDDNLTLTKNV